MKVEDEISRLMTTRIRLRYKLITPHGFRDLPLHKLATLPVMVNSFVFLFLFIVLLIQWRYRRGPSTSQDKFPPLRRSIHSCDSNLFISFGVLTYSGPYHLSFRNRAPSRASVVNIMLTSRRFDRRYSAIDRLGRAGCPRKQLGWFSL